ncbi:MAG TPA: PBP1A family penicillin-binding protein [bacterium]|nr:PBP1A family penicillin-binding protein [bacterium]
MPIEKVEKARKPFLTFLKYAFILGFALSGIVLGFLYAQLQELPDIKLLQTSNPAQATRIYDVNGEVISQLWLEQRTVVSLDKIPQTLQDALIAIEDDRFYRHIGIDPIGMARAFIQNVRHGGQKLQGASTLTQQLARNLFLTHEKTFSRKIREILLALQIERNYSKKEILEMYLNQIYFGEGAYGVESAARSYFGKHVEDLTLPECALLASLPKAPNDYDPYKRPLDALARRNLDLSLMADHGFITQQECTEARNTPIELKKIEVQNAPYFVEYVRQQLEQRYGSQMVYKGGLSVYTTLDLKMQEAAQKALSRGVANAEIVARRVRQTTIPVDQPIQGALLAMDPHTGAIRAMIGGIDYRKSVFNRAIQAKRQPGSAFKPFIYAAAIENGYTMADVFLDSPVVYDDPSTGKPWRPTNFSGKFRGPTTLHTALMYSINVVTIKLLEKLGIQPVVSVARRMGISTPIKPNLTLGLGTSEVTLQDLVQAFSVFANQGVRVEPFAILSVKDSSGKVLETNTPSAQDALDPEVAYIMAHTMKDVVDNGTGRIVRRLGFTYPAAGKTGTTNDNVDAWFIGYTPSLTCGVWVGYDERQSLGHRQTGGEAAAPIWAEFMKVAMEGKPVEDFQPPKGTEADFVHKKICLDSGLLASAFCPRTRDEIFRKETAPTRLCNLHTGGATLNGLDSSSNDNGAGQPAGDLLEMGAPAMVKSATPNTTPEEEEPAKTAPVSQEAYPDEGF